MLIKSFSNNNNNTTNNRLSNSLKWETIKIKDTTTDLKTSKTSNDYDFLLYKF